MVKCCGGSGSFFIDRSSSLVFRMTPPPSPPQPENAGEQAADPPFEAQESKPELLSILVDVDVTEQIEKHKKYVAMYSRRLKGKYFSNKASNGGNIFDHETIIDDEVIKSSRWPCTRLFADPIQNLQKENGWLSREVSALPNRKLDPEIC